MLTQQNRCLHGAIGQSSIATGNHSRQTHTTTPLGLPTLTFVTDKSNRCTPPFYHPHNSVESEQFDIGTKSMRCSELKTCVVLVLFFAGLLILV